MPTRRPAAALALAAGLVVIAGGVTGLLLTRHSTPAMRPAAVGVGAVPAPTGPIVAAFPAPSGPIVAVSQSAAPKPVAAPVSLTIPLIGVQTNLMTLGLAPDGELQVPPPNMVSVAGWYTGSPRPGAIGSSIIVGHIDGDAGNVKGVFFRLRQLSAGDKIYVKRSDGPWSSSGSPRSSNTRRTTSRPRPSTVRSPTRSCASSPAAEPLTSRAATT